MCASAVKASYDLAAQAIVVATRSGKTAKLISGFRPSCPIIAVTRHESTLSQDGSHLGCAAHPRRRPARGDPAAASQATSIAKYFNLVHKGDTIVAVASTGIEDANTLTIDRV